jgi:hypothetical protein
MSKYQSNIIWLGLIMIVLNIAVHMSEVKSVIFGNGTTTTSSSTSSTSVGTNSLTAQTTPREVVV